MENTQEEDIAAIKTDVESIKSTTQTTGAKVANIESAVDGVEGKLDTLNATAAAIEDEVDGLEGAMTTLNTTVNTIKTNTDDVESKLDTVITNTHNIDENTDEVEDELETVIENTHAIDENTDEVEDELVLIYAQEQQIYGAIPDIRRAVTNTKVAKFYIGDNPTSHSEEIHFKETEDNITALLTAGYRPYMFLGVDGHWSYWLFAKYTAQNTHIPAN